MSETPFARKRSRPETPVDRVVAAFGAARASALAAVTTDAVRKWNRPMSGGGCGGLIPSRYQAIYLEAAVAEGLKLAAQDLIARPYA